MLHAPLSRVQNLLRRFARNERGAVLILFAMSLITMVGMAALSSDLGRQMRMNTELQEMADAAALAAAKELDGEGDAIARAVAAATFLRDRVNRANVSTFAQNDVRLVELRFAREWRDLDANRVPLAVVTLPGGALPDASVQRQAAWVQAVTDVGSVTTIFAGVLGGPAQMQTSARATAGTEYVACAVQPLFMCLPPEGVNLDPGMMIRVRQSPGSAWGPGNFGLLQPPNEEKDNAAKINQRITRNLARSDPPICFVNALRPTQGIKKDAVHDGLNVRFDIFDKNNKDPEIELPPAPNVLKGVTADSGDSCVKTPFQWKNNTAYPGRMPRDPCFATDTCDAGAFGKGGWDATEYWQHHHGETIPGGLNTRFAVYMAQMGLNVDGTSRTKPPASTEPMAPVCAPSIPITGIGSWERRVIYAAMIDCVKNEEWLKGNSAKESPIRAADIGKFFITEPTEGQEIFLEFVDRITVNDETGKLQAIVQLYPNPSDPP
jgi:Flp pilus assembly protein TadG